MLASRAAAGSAAVLGFGDRAVYVHVPGGETLTWRDGEWRILPLQVDGEVIALTGNEDSLALLVRRDDGVWLLHWRDGASLHSEPIAERASAAQIWTGGALLLADGATLRYRDASGIERTHDMGSEVRSLSAISDGWVQVELAGRRMALELAADGERFFVLPGGAR
jgi:hypothetical protein